MRYYLGTTGLDGEPLVSRIVEADACEEAYAENGDGTVEDCLEPDDHDGIYLPVS